MLTGTQLTSVRLALLVVTIGFFTDAWPQQANPKAPTKSAQANVASNIRALSQEEINALTAAPEPDDDSDDDQTLEDMFLQRSSIGTMTIRGYKLCKVPYNERLYVACGALACPAGSEMVAWSPEAHPSCNATPTCVDMKQLGWSGRGNKNNFCKAKGYDGVKPYSGAYRKGGRCFKGNGCG